MLKIFKTKRTHRIGIVQKVYEENPVRDWLKLILTFNDIFNEQNYNW